MTDEEIDREIAVKAMGWKLLDRKAFGWGDGPPVYATIPKNAEPGEYSSPTYQGFYPSSDIAAAFKVVEKMRKDEDVYRITIDTFEGGWCCEIEFQNNDPVGKVYGEDKSLPRAICLAALKASEGGRDDNA